MKFRQRLERFMYGRYGMDKLSLCILWTALAIMVINSFFNSFIVYVIELLLIGYCFFRFLSKNIGKRYDENQKFNSIISLTASFFKLRRAMFRDRKTHVYTKCPHCKANIRLPKKVGKHVVRCPKCQKTFDFSVK